MNVVIKLPNSLNQRVLCFPMLHQLYKYLEEQLEEDEILNVHLLSVKSDIEVLNLLPFHAYYHELDSADLKNIFTVHRACTQIKMELNLDLFISMTESFVDVCFGFFLKAKKKVGFDISKNSILLSNKIPLPADGIAYVDKVYTLLDGVMLNNDTPPRMRSVFSRELESYYDDYQENPYVIVDLPMIKGEIDPEWKELFSLVSGMTFVLMCSKLDPINAKIELKQFIEQLAPQNIYKIFEHSSLIEFGKLGKGALCFIGNWNDYALVNSYIGGKNFVAHHSFPEKDLECFIGKNIAVVTPGVSKGTDKFYNQIFDNITNYINSITKES